VGAIRCVRAVASGRNARRRVGRRPWARGGVWVVEGLVVAGEGIGGGKETYVPFVASEACCRNDALPAKLNISIGTPILCAAKMVFMKGMYCVGLAVETLITSIRDMSAGAEAFKVVEGVEAVERERSVVCLFM